MGGGGGGGGEGEDTAPKWLAHCMDSSSSRLCLSPSRDHCGQGTLHSHSTLSTLDDKIVLTNEMLLRNHVMDR